MDDNNKENVEPEEGEDALQTPSLTKSPKVRLENVDLNASDDDSCKGEWAVVYDESDSSVASLAQDDSIIQKPPNDENQPEPDVETANVVDPNFNNGIDLQSQIVEDVERTSKNCIDLKDLHNFGLKIDEIDFSSDASDIDIIDEASFDLLSPNCDAHSEMSVSLSSVVSQYSSMTAIREHFLEQIARQELAHGKQFWNENANDDSKSEANSENSIDSPLRGYVHQRNTVLNGKLTLILVLSITAVAGLGIGHFIGWSNQWQHSNQLSMGQVIKLKHLQDDLLSCMKSQNEADFDNDPFQIQALPEKEVCHRDFEYWKNRFETFFEENKGILELFQRTQKHIHDNPDNVAQSKGGNFEYVSEADCVNKTTSDAFNQLEINVLVRQLEHLNMLEVLEKVKKSVKQVKVLREENEDLKKKLEEEEHDDEIIVQEWGSKVAELQQENEKLVKTIVSDEEEDLRTIANFEHQIERLTAENGELRTIIAQLGHQVLDSGAENSLKSSRPAEKTVNDHSGSMHDSYVAQYTLLRDQINELVSENQEMKENIARSRWSDRNKDVDERVENDKLEMNQKIEAFKTKFSFLQRQLLLEQEESKRWKENFENLLTKFKKIELEKNSQRATNGEQQYQQQQNSANQESIPVKGQKLLNKFYDELKEKWEVLHKKYHKKLNEAYDHLHVNFDSAEAKEEMRKHGDRLVKFGQYLENVMENVQNYSEKLIERGMKSQVMSFFSDKLTDLTNIIENNFAASHKATPAAAADSAKSQSSNTNSEPMSTPTATKNSGRRDSKRSKSRKSSSSSRINKQQAMKDDADWATARARAREQYRKYAR